MLISGLYLAAGQSKRMGTRKQSLELAPGRMLASLGLRALTSGPIAEIAVVVHPDDPAAWLSSAIKEGEDKRRLVAPPVHVVACEESIRGMSCSIRSGMHALMSERPELDAVIIALADQPFVTAGMVNRLAEYWSEHMHLDFVASASDVPEGDEAVLLPPALLSRSMFGDLLRLEGDKGARGLLRSSRYSGSGVLVSESACLLDVDTPEDFEFAKKLYLGGITKDK